MVGGCKPGGMIADAEDRASDMGAPKNSISERSGPTLSKVKIEPLAIIALALAFVGFGPESEQAALELTYNWDTPRYDLGTGFGHVALEVDDASAACAEIKRRGGTVTREAGPMKHGTTVIAFVQDPDGYKIELIQNKAA